MPFTPSIHIPSRTPETCEECQAFVKNQIVKKSWDESYWNMEVVFSAAYAISMLLMGRLDGRDGIALGICFCMCSFWTLASMLHAVAPEIGGLFGNAVIGFFICRILLGLGEGGNFPAAIKTIAEWFPKERTGAGHGIFKLRFQFRRHARAVDTAIHGRAILHFDDRRRDRRLARRFHHHGRH